jgi:TP901 family phage tail tape measure protein
MALDNLTIRIRAVGARAAAADISGVAASTRSVGKNVVTMGRRIRSLGTDLTHGLTVPIAGVGIAAGKMASDFNAELTRIHTQAGASKKDIALFHDAILRMSQDPTIGKTPQELAEGLFSLASIGLKPAKALDALRVSAQAATVGNADLESTVGALGGAWIANIKGGRDFKTVVANMNAAVGAGNQRMQDLIRSMGTGIVPTAKEAGLSLQDVLSAGALLTDEGYQASSAMAQLATAIHYTFPREDTVAAKAFHRIGLRTTDLVTTMRGPRGLFNALKELHDHLDALPGGATGIKAQRALIDILPGGRGRVLRVLLNNYDRLDRKTNQIAKTTNNFGEAVKTTAGTPAQQLAHSMNLIRVALIKLGEAIIPVVVPMIQDLAGGIESVTKWFDRLSPSQQRTIVRIGLVLAVLGPLVVVFGLLATAVGAIIEVGGILLTVLNPVTIAIAAVAAAVIYAYTHWKWFRDAVAKFRQTLVDVWPVIKFTANAIGDLVYVLAHPGQSASHVWDWLVTAFTDATNFVIDRFNWLIGAFNDTLGRVPGVHNLGTIDHMLTPAEQRAAAANSTGGVKIHQRPSLDAWIMRHFPKEGTGTLSHGPFSTGRGLAPDQLLHVTINMDGRKVAEGVHRAAVKKKSTR